MKKILFLYFTYVTLTFAHTTEYVAVEGKHSDVWSKYSPSSKDNVSRLVDLLKRSKTGEELLKSASRKAAYSGLTIVDVIEPGEGSITDTTLIRRFHPQRADRVTYETKAKIFINKDLAWREAILDLAHELTHYIHRESFNPYTINFSLADFIKSTIEADGGEAHAFVKECQVMRELFTREFLANSSCSGIQSDLGEFSLDKTKELFYQVGSFYDQIKQLLSSKDAIRHFKHLSSEKIKFVSSAYGVPYPLAAIYEYQAVLTKVCENDKRRLAYMQQSRGRGPASIEDFKNDYFTRCPQSKVN